MSEISDSMPATRPSALGAFARGAASGVISGAVMMGILFAVSFIPAFAPLAPHFALACGTVLATGLFGGAMATKRAIFDVPSSQHANTMVMPVPVMAAGAAPAIAPTVALADEAYEHAPTKNWAASVGRGDDSKTRIEQILQNGAMADKERATAILASRDAADQQNYR